MLEVTHEEASVARAHSSARIPRHEKKKVFLFTTSSARRINVSVGGSGVARLLRKCLRAFSPSEWEIQVHNDVTSIVNKYLCSN